jgi:hypothetical protein
MLPADCKKRSLLPIIPPTTVPILALATASYLFRCHSLAIYRILTAHLSHVDRQRSNWRLSGKYFRIVQVPCGRPGVCMNKVSFFKHPSLHARNNPVSDVFPRTDAQHMLGRIAQNRSACSRALSHGSGYGKDMIDSRLGRG